MHFFKEAFIDWTLIFITMITSTLTCIGYFDFYYGVFLIIII